MVRGLYLQVETNGSKLWRLKYRFLGKEKKLSLGAYPEIGLAQARERQLDARRLLANGVDPGEHKKQLKRAAKVMAANSFEAVGREWFAKFSPTWAKSHSDKVLLRLENDVDPWLGSRPIAAIQADEMIQVLRRIEARGPLPPLQGEHLASVTDPAGIGELLRTIDGYQGNLRTRCALRLNPLVFVRPINLRKAEWSHVHLNDAQWRIPGELLKMREDWIVPLSRQTIEILREIHPVTGQGRYLFPCEGNVSRAMSENTINGALRRLGYSGDEMTGHGFRAMARTVLDEVLNFRVEWIEMQLAHEVKDLNGRAYNRTTFLEGRTPMM